MAEVGMPVGKASSMTRFFEELHQLLGRLSPGRRRAGLAELRPLERQGLEAWILARQSDQAKERRRLQGPKMPRSTQPSSGARSSVVTFSQRTLKGTSRWYYAVVCLPGLHILSRMRRQRHSAVEDSKVLADAKRRVSEASRTGRSFDQAVREALGGAFWDGSQVPVKSATSPGTRRRPRAGSTAFEPQALHLRFYAAVDLGGGFATMLRAPCCYDLDEALRARRRLLAAVHLEEPDQRLSTVPFSRCTEVLERVRQTHGALHQEAGRSASKAFGRVRRLVLQTREKRSWSQLQQLLRKRRGEMDYTEVPRKRLHTKQGGSSEKALRSLRSCACEGTPSLIQSS